jgi:hypothetical protein
MVGFVHGTADLNPLDAAAAEGYVETRFIKRAEGGDIATSSLVVSLTMIVAHPTN